MKWLEITLTILLVGIVIMVVAMLLTGCAGTEVRDGILYTKPQLTEEAWKPPEADMELVGCVEGTCTYTFYRTRRCFLTIGQANKMNTDSWMFDLECPG